jgi:hypothetical protein
VSQTCLLPHPTGPKTSQFQGLPGNGRDCAGNRKRPPNDPWGMVSSACKKNTFQKKNFLMASTILFTTNCKYCPLQIPSNVKPKGNLGKIIPVVLKYLIYAMQNKIVPVGHPSDLAPVKYPTGVTDSSRKYFS